MKLTRTILPGLILLLIFSGCTSTTRIKNQSLKESQKRTVTFLTQSSYGGHFKLNNAENTIANCFLDNEKDYFSKYIQVNYDSVWKEHALCYAELNYWNKTRLTFSRKRRYRLFAKFAGTDHIMDLDIDKKYVTDTARENHRSFMNVILLGETDAEGHGFNESVKIKYKFRYADGHTGKTLWSMKFRYPSGFFGTVKKNPMGQIKKKFEKRFPYKITVKK